VLSTVTYSEPVPELEVIVIPTANGMILMVKVTALGDAPV
jgi:hypothetical protein